MSVNTQPETITLSLEGNLILNRQRAVSEIIGSLMILMIVSALGTFLFNYTLTTLSNENLILEQDVNRASNKVQQRLRIINIDWQEPLNQLNITVLNYGMCDIKIVDVYVNNERVNTFLNGQGETISTMRLGWIGFLSPNPITADTLNDIVVVSEKGASHVYSFKS